MLSCRFRAQPKRNPFSALYSCTGRKLQIGAQLLRNCCATVAQPKRNRSATVAQPFFSTLLLHRTQVTDWRATVAQLLRNRSATNITHLRLAVAICCESDFQDLRPQISLSSDQLTLLSMPLAMPASSDLRLSPSFAVPVRAGLGGCDFLRYGNTAQTRREQQTA